MTLRFFLCLLSLALAISYFSIACGTGDGGACNDDSQCPSASPGEVGDSCYVPGVASGGPVIKLASCSDDSGCATAEVCTGGFCSPSCTSDGDCDLTDSCATGGHCVPRTCAQCPSYFACAAGECTVPACDEDAQCPGGYCVNRTCSPAIGICQPSHQ